VLGNRETLDSCSIGRRPRKYFVVTEPDPPEPTVAITRLD
jgi:hypothetical protein